MPISAAVDTPVGQTTLPLDHSLAGDHLSKLEPSHNLVSDDVISLDFVAESTVPTKKGFFRIRAYRDTVQPSEPMAVIAGQLSSKRDVVVRVHDQCATSEVFGSLKCDCKEQLDLAMTHIQREGGMVIYLQQEGRGIGLANKIRAYALQEHGLDTVDANVHMGFEPDERKYLCVPHILRDCGVESIRLMTNNPRKVQHLTDLGVSITGLIPAIVPSTAHNRHYLQTKADRMGHDFGAESNNNNNNSCIGNERRKPQILDPESSINNNCFGNATAVQILAGEADRPVDVGIRTIRGEAGGARNRNSKTDK
eukprot:155858_1